MYLIQLVMTHVTLLPAPNAVYIGEPAVRTTFTPAPGLGVLHLTITTITIAITAAITVPELGTPHIISQVPARDSAVLLLTIMAPYSNTHLASLPTERNYIAHLTSRAPELGVTQHANPASELSKHLHHAVVLMLARFIPVTRMQMTTIVVFQSITTTTTNPPELCPCVPYLLLTQPLLLVRRILQSVLWLAVPEHRGMFLRVPESSRSREPHLQEPVYTDQHLSFSSSLHLHLFSSRFSSLTSAILAQALAQAPAQVH